MNPFVLSIPECNSRRFWSLSSVSSIHSKAQHTHTHTDKHTHKTLRFFFRCKDIISISESEKREYSKKLCYTRKRKMCVCDFKCCWSISARRRQNARAASCKNFSFFGFELLLLKIVLKRLEREGRPQFFLIYSHLSGKGFSYQIPSFPAV